MQVIHLVEVGASSIDSDNDCRSGTDVMASVDELKEIIQLSDPAAEEEVCGLESKRARADDVPRGAPLHLAFVLEETEQRAESQQPEQGID